LQRYTNLNKAINNKLLERERLRSLAEKCTSSITGMPRGARTGRTDIYIRLIEIEDEINEQIDKYADIRTEIEEAINTVNDVTLRALLWYRYLSGFTWDVIALKINKSIPMTRIKLHDRALREVKI
jgi:hypothetical protein